MAPVGRWQKNKDLSWYAKSDTSPAALTAAEQRKEEIRKIKEAEESALSEALGYGPTIRNNANETPIGQKEVEKAIKETAEGDDEDAPKGVGFGGFDRGVVGKEESEVLGGVGLDTIGKNLTEKRRGGDRIKEKRRRSRSRDSSRERRHRRHTHGEERPHRRHKSRDRSRHRSRDRSGDRHLHRRERPRSYGRRREDEKLPRRHRERSFSPSPHRRRRYSRDKDYDNRR